MSTQPSPRGGEQNQVRWTFVGIICLAAIATCSLIIWLRPAPPPATENAEISQPEELEPGPDIARSAAPTPRRNSERQPAAAVSSVSPVHVNQADKMAVLAASTGITDELEKIIQDLAALGNSVVPELEKLIAAEQNVNVREAAARTLAEIGTPESVSVLLTTVLAEPNDEHRRALVSALHALNNSASAGELAGALLETQDPIAFPTIRDTLARVADGAAVHTIAETFQYATQEGWQQSNLMGVMARIRASDAVPALREIVFGDSDSSLRSQAAISLGLIGTQDAIQALLDAINQSQSTSLTTVLVESLGAVNNKESLANLVSLLNQSSNENIRYAAAAALGNISSETSANALNSALHTESSQIVRQTIESSLAKLNQPNNFPGD